VSDGIGTVVVTSRSFSSGTVDLVGRLTEAGLTVVTGHSGHDAAELAPALVTASAWIAGTAPITTEHLERAPRLRIIARYGVGVDSVDLAAAARAGVLVTNTPGANSEAVAEHAVGLLFATARGIPAGDRRVRHDDWTISHGRQVAGSVAGVVGFGRIGRGAARRLSALGCDVLVHDPYVAEAEILAAGFRPASLRQLRSTAGLVSLHVPGGAPLIDAEWLAECAVDQIIVNTARADLVDEAALAGALRSGRVFAYAADTLAVEVGGAGPSPLLAGDLADRVVVTPHLGAQTVEAVDRMGSLAVADVMAVLEGREPAHPVPVPRGDDR
jgi:D-3-phosphoglycerate dehydrogenase